MNFETYIDQAWTDHVDHSQKVADSFSEAVANVETNEQLTQLIALVTHVMGEHLKKWSDGQRLLESFEKNRTFTIETETDMALRRSIAVMQLGRNELPSLDAFGPSDQIRILATTASALCEGETLRSKELLQKAVSLSRLGIEKKDPANRTLAITGNNLACALEEKKSRTPAETELMIFAAKIGREYWELAGHWLEISRAEYRLGIAYIEANDLIEALNHALICLKMCRENKADNVDMFFAFEVLAKVEKARKNELEFQSALGLATEYFEKLGADDKSYCESSLKKLKL